jgi:hypothetical protein
MKRYRPTRNGNRAGDFETQEEAESEAARRGWWVRSAVRGIILLSLAATASGAQVDTVGSCSGREHFGGPADGVSVRRSR